MYTKNKAAIVRILDDYAAKCVKKQDALQGLQNIIGEEIERKDLPVDKYEVEE